MKELDNRQEQVLNNLVRLTRTLGMTINNDLCTEIWGDENDGEINELYEGLDRIREELDYLVYDFTRRLEYNGYDITNVYN